MNPTPQVHGPDPQSIKNLFSSIAAGYDKANDVITLGRARAWRRELVRWSGCKEGQRVLDCATGTGDLALEFKRVVGDSGEVIGTDFCREMLALAPEKAREAKLNIQFQLADAMNLPFPPEKFDVVSIAYGIRNVADPIKALSEMARVCKPGGCVMVLETGDSQWPVMEQAFQLYFKHVVPRLGGWLTGRRSAYEYLSKSSANFPSRNRFLQIMNATGAFSLCEYEGLMGGASFVYRGVVAQKTQST